MDWSQFEGKSKNYNGDRPPARPMPIPNGADARLLFMQRFMRKTPPAFDPPVDKRGNKARAKK